MVSCFSTRRFHVAWMYVWWVCTHAAGKKNLNTVVLKNYQSHDHCLWVSRNVARVRRLIYATWQKPCRKRVYLDCSRLLSRGLQCTSLPNINKIGQCAWLRYWWFNKLSRPVLQRVRIGPNNSQSDSVRPSVRLSVCLSVCLSVRHIPVFCPDEWRYFRAVFSIR